MINVKQLRHVNFVRISGVYLSYEKVKHVVHDFSAVTRKSKEYRDLLLSHDLNDRSARMALATARKLFSDKNKSIEQLIAGSLTSNKYKKCLYDAGYNERDVKELQKFADTGELDESYEQGCKPLFSTVGSMQWV